MDCGWQGIALAGALAWVAGAAAQALNPSAPEGGAPLLTLGSPMLRAAMDRVNVPGGFVEKIPDFRLKLDRSEDVLRNPLGLDEHLRGVEIRLPMSAVWLGYNLPTEGAEPQATFSIQLGF